MPDQPLVSVIVPCYNYGRFLAEALESLLAQTYSNWECIIVNDGSNDNTEEVSNQYVQKDTRFKYIYQNNGGVSSARNRTLEEARGEYIQLLDADDLLESEKLRLQVNLLEENPNVDLVFSNMIFFSDTDKTVLSEPKLLLNKKPVSGSGDIILESLLDDSIFLPGCTLSRKSLYADVGFFKKGIEGIEDWDYFYRAALLQKIFKHDNRIGTGLLVRSHGTNASNNRYIMWTNKIKARKSLMDETKKHLERTDSNFTKRVIRKASKIHKALLNRDKARLNLFYGNLAKGCTQVIKHAFFSKRPYFAFYDGAYWIKERIKRSFALSKNG